jgi:cation transport ATPase
METAPGESAEEVLRLAASLEQASHHVVAEAIIKAAVVWAAVTRRKIPA